MTVIVVTNNTQSIRVGRLLALKSEDESMVVMAVGKFEGWGLGRRHAFDADEWSPSSLRQNRQMVFNMEAKQISKVQELIRRQWFAIGYENECGDGEGLTCVSHTKKPFETRQSCAPRVAKHVSTPE